MGAGQDPTYVDPTAQLRKRVTMQLTGDPTAAPTLTGAPGPSTPSPQFQTSSVTTGGNTTAPGPSTTAPSSTTTAATPSPSTSTSPYVPLPSPGPGYTPTTNPTTGAPGWRYTGNPATQPPATMQSGQAPTSGNNGQNVSLNDPASAFNTYLARYPGNPQAAIDAWNAAGDPGGLKPAWESGSQTIGLANGTYLVAPHTGGNSSDTWQVVQRNPEDGGSSTGTVTAGTSDFENQVRALLMQRIAADTTPVDENSSGITGAVNAARDEATRQSQAERTALAEQDYAANDGSLQTNAIPMEIQQSAEKNATSLGTLRANLILTEYQNKRADLQQAESQAMASGDAESARQIQAAIANLDAELQREGYGVQMAEFTQQQNNQATTPGLTG